MGLASHANVYGTCLQILRSRGLEVRGEPEPDGRFPVACDWIARKWDFYSSGGNPTELLGPFAVNDHVQPLEDYPYWWSVEGPDIHWELQEAAFPDEASEADPAIAPDAGLG